jgi:hypothetical protein
MHSHLAGSAWGERECDVVDKLPVVAAQGLAAVVTDRVDPYPVFPFPAMALRALPSQFRLLTLPQPSSSPAEL